MLAAWSPSRAKLRGGPLSDALDNVTSAATRICYQPKACSCAALIDPDLKGVSAIVFDNFTNGISTEHHLGPRSAIQESTRPIHHRRRVGHLDVATIRNIFTLVRCCPPSRTYPVAVEYLSKPAGEPGQRARCQRWDPQGDALIFMPGVYEIGRTVQAAGDMLGQEFAVFPLRGIAADQDAAVARQTGGKSLSRQTLRKLRSPSTVFAW
jgi:ATP-dependent helicase HrpB